jgi:glycosyltransferase involved in cell wall biosynthesis
VAATSVVPEHRRGRTLFMVWGPPSHGPRSRVFAGALGVPIEFVFSTMRRGLLIAPWKYGRQALSSIALLIRRRPEVVFVQSPPSFAVLFAWLYGLFSGARFVVDAHSGAMMSRYWTRPRWLNRFLARRALATIVTNERFAVRIRSWGGRAIVLRDIPTTFETDQPLPRDERFSVLVVSTFAPDEPLVAIIEAASRLPEAHFYVTGNLRRADPRLVASPPENLEFTGYVDDGAYYATMKDSDAVMCLTTRDDTMQRGACEALSLARPIITSDWQLLRDYFAKGTVHVAATADEIVRGVRAMISEHERFRREIEELQDDQKREWEKASAELARLLTEGDEVTPTGGRGNTRGIGISDT